MIIIIRKRRLLKILGAAAILGIFVFALFNGADYAAKRSISTSADGNWGLSFQEAGKTPIGNATQDYLKKYSGYYAGSSSEKVLYLTFDAGYENGHTGDILDVLKKHHVKAAFFLVGNYIASAPQLVRRMEREGHLVGNHTFTHPDMSELASKEEFADELSQLEKLYKKTTGKEMKKYYRPPQGKYSESNLKMAREMGYKTIFWSLAYVDWYESNQPTREEALEKLMPRTHPGAIVLLHSTSETNSRILDELLGKWEKMGYKFKSLETL